jgi:hypothetical protein
LKRISILLAVSLAFATPAAADVYVKVDANGVAVDGPIMCDSGTCGPNSTFSKLTLKPGEQYVLQGTGQAGIGGNNPNTEVKVDLKTNEWTVTNTQTQQVTQQFVPQNSPGNDRPTQVVQVPVQETKTAVVETKTATVDSSTVKVETSTVKVESSTATAQMTVVELQTMVRNLLTRLWALLRELKK